MFLFPRITILLNRNFGGSLKHLVQLRRCVVVHCYIYYMFYEPPLTFKLQVLCSCQSLLNECSPDIRLLYQINVFNVPVLCVPLLMTDTLTRCPYCRDVLIRLLYSINYCLVLFFRYHWLQITNLVNQEGMRL